MNETTTTDSFTARRILSLGITAYCVVWAVGFVFVCRVFGSGGAIILSLMLAVPLAIAMRLRLRQPAARGTEFVYLFLLSAFVLGGTAYTIWDWYETGMDRVWAEDVRFAELTRIVHRDPAFRSVECSVTDYKGRYDIRGSVASQVDLDHLKSLGAQYGFLPYMDDIEVTDRPKKTNRPQ